MEWDLSQPELTPGEIDTLLLKESDLPDRKLVSIIASAALDKCQAYYASQADKEMVDRLAHIIQENTDFAKNLSWVDFDEDAQEGFREKARCILSLLQPMIAAKLDAKQTVAEIANLKQQLADVLEAQRTKRIKR